MIDIARAMIEKTDNMQWSQVTELLRINLDETSETKVRNALGGSSVDGSWSKKESISLISSQTKTQTEEKNEIPMK